MPHVNNNRRTPAAAAVLACLLAALLLSACGGSSKGSTSSATSASATGAPNAPNAPNATGGGKPGGPGAARFEALRECLQKNGITLPARTPGQRGAPGTGSGGFRGGAGRQLPKGVTQAQFQAALKKCGGTNFLRRGRFGAGAAQGYAKFASCMAKNGVKLPAPNTSGKGPIFNTKGIDTKSAAFKAADAKCARELGRGRPGSPQGGQPAGPPPAQ
jgi:hypothetical protein